MSGKSGIPAWQRAADSDSNTPQPSPPAETPQPEQQAEASPAPTAAAPISEPQTSEADSNLLDQAAKFLEDPNIRDASRERKVVFLQAKGVKQEDIDKLLANTAAHVAEDGARAWSSGSHSMPHDATKLPSNIPQPPPAAAPTRPQARDMPPIVTFPEYLTQPAQPPPLITTQRLVNTAYITGTLMATLYGVTRYIIAPMTQNLAESRQDFASHTKEQLDEFNSRLGDMVSVDPATKTKAPASDVLDDASEADSDPTELYHRDFGTQTTPTLSRRQSDAKDKDDSVVARHENRLNILTSHIKELDASRANDNASSNSLRTQLSDLQTYLGEMSYQNQYYNSMNGIYGATYGVPKGKDGKDDHIEALKGDIRAVKGVLLSARNFPAGGPRNAGRAGG